MGNEFRIEINPRAVRDKTVSFQMGSAVVMAGSTGGYADDWLARIEIAPDTYLQLFPKYGLVAMEINSNGNTNLPAECTADELLHHLFKGSGQGRVRINSYDDPRTRVRRSKAKMRRAILELKSCADSHHESWGLAHKNRG